MKIFEENKTEEQEGSKEDFQGTKCEVFSRVVGYIRPVSQWNEGKEAEFKDRKNFEIS